MNTSWDVKARELLKEVVDDLSEKEISKCYWMLPSSLKDKIKVHNRLYGIKVKGFKDNEEIELKCGKI